MDRRAENAQLAELRKLIRGTAERLASPFQLDSPLPVDGSPYLREQSSDERSPDGSSWEPDALQLPGAIATHSALAVEGNLNGVASMLEPRARAGLAPLALTRVVAEGAARGWWLVDPDVTVRERVARAYRLRIDGLKGATGVAERLTNVPAPVVAEQRARLHECYGEVERLGLGRVQREDGVPTGFHGPKFDREEVIEAMLDSQGFPGLGVITWRFASGIVHTTLDGVQPYYDEGTRSIRSDADTYNPFVGLAALTSIAFLERTNLWLGESNHSLLQWRKFVLRTIRQGIPDDA